MLRYKVDSADVSFSEFSICAVSSSVLLTHGESTPFAPINFMLSKAPSTSFVSASNVISSFCTSILIVRFKIFNSFASLAENPMWLVCFTSNSFSRTFPKVCKGLQLLPSCNHTEVVTMTQSFEISIATAEESWARGSDFHGTLFQHF